MTDDPRVTTWANDFGVWHVRVRIHGPVESSGAVIIARQALRDELLARESTDHPVPSRFWKNPVRCPDLDTENTIVYREADVEEEA